MAESSAQVSPQATHEKKMAALYSVGSAVVLVSLKVFIAIATGSLDMLS